MIVPESELMAQAQRAVREARFDDAQGLLVSAIVQEPMNDEAWLMLAEVVPGPERKMECLERARRIDPGNPATLRAIQSLQRDIALAAFGQAPIQAAADSSGVSVRPNLAGPLLQHAETVARSIIMSTEPNATRSLGLELAHLVEVAMSFDEMRARRWARTAARDPLVKYEGTITVLIANLPQNDPQLGSLREQRKKALDLLK